MYITSEAISLDNVCLELSPAAVALSLDTKERPEKRIQRLVNENPVIILSCIPCCTCHVMRSLLTNAGVHPTVIKLDDSEMRIVLAGGGESASSSASTALAATPVDFTDGSLVGGIDSLMALHPSDRLVPRLRGVKDGYI